MGVSVACTSVAAPTSGGTTTQDITVAGFGTVKAYLLVATSAGTPGTPAAHWSMTVGASDGTVQCGASTFAEDNVASTDTYRLIYDTAVLVVLTPTGTEDARAVHSAFISDGIRIDWTDYPSAAVRLGVVLFGGTDLSAVVGTGVLLPNAGGAQSVATGHQSDQVLFWATSQIAANAISPTALLSLGMANRGASIAQVALSIFSADNVSPTDMSAVLRATRCVQVLGLPTTLARAAELTAFGATDFTLTKRDADGDFFFGFLSLAYGGHVPYTLLTVDSPTGTGAAPVTTPGFRPQALLSLATFLPVLDVPQPTEPDGAGALAVAAVTAAAEWCLGVSDETNQTPSDTQSLSDTKALAVARGTGGQVLTATGPSGSGSFDATGYTLDYTAVDATARKMAVLVIGVGAVPSGPGPLLAWRRHSLLARGWALLLAAAQALWRCWA